MSIDGRQESMTLAVVFVAIIKFFRDTKTSKWNPSRQVNITHECEDIWIWSKLKQLTWHSKVNVRFQVSTLLPFFLPPFLSTFCPAFLPVSIPDWLPSFFPAFLPSCLASYFPACLPSVLLGQVACTIYDLAFHNEINWNIQLFFIAATWNFFFTWSATHTV